MLAELDFPKETNRPTTSSTCIERQKSTPVMRTGYRGIAASRSMMCVVACWLSSDIKKAEASLRFPDHSMRFIDCFDGIATQEADQSFAPGPAIIDQSHVNMAYAIAGVWGVGGTADRDQFERVRKYARVA